MLIMSHLYTKLRSELQLFLVHHTGNNDASGYWLADNGFDYDLLIRIPFLLQHEGYRGIISSAEFSTANDALDAKPSIASFLKTKRIAGGPDNASCYLQRTGVS